MNPITMKLVVDDLILQALREDITFEDVSTASVCPTARPATVELIAKADGIIAGLDVFSRTFELLDPQSSVLFDVSDSDEVHAGDHVGQVRGGEGPAQMRHHHRGDLRHSASQQQIGWGSGRILDGDQRIADNLGRFVGNVLTCRVGHDVSFR